MGDTNTCTVCRLCLKVKSGNDVIMLEGIKRLMLVFTIPEMDLDVCSNPMMCTECSVNLQTSFEFKTACLETNVDFIKNEDSSEENVDPAQKPFNIPTKERNSCCLCSKCFQKNSFRGSRVDDVFLKTMMETCLSELNLDEMRISTPCIECMEGLENMFAFFNVCLEGEEKIKSYCKYRTVYEEINLYDLIKSDPFAMETPCETISVEMVPSDDKSEDNSEFSESYEEPDLYIKTEEIDLTEEQQSDYESYEKNETAQQQEEFTYEDSYYKCLICPFQTIHRTSIKGHVLVHKHPSEVNMQRCHLCSYTTKHKHCLRTHMFVHKKPDQLEAFSCHLCSFVTRRKIYLHKHMIIHMDPSQIKMHKCTRCKYQTRRKGDLNKHMHSHRDAPVAMSSSGTSVYKCSLCVYESIRSGDLSRHRKLAHRC